MITGLAFAGFKLLSSGRIGRLAALGATAFIMNTIILTESRGALVGMAACAPLAFFLAPRRTRRTIALLSGLGVVMLLLLAHRQFWERMQTINQYETESSAHSRFELIPPSLRMFEDHPLGVGTGGFRALSPIYVPGNLLSEDGTRSPHTTVLAVLTDQGIVGIVLYGLLVASVCRRLFRARRTVIAATSDPRLVYYIAAIACGLVAFSVCGLTGNYLKVEVQIWMIGMLAVIPALAAAQGEREATEPTADPPGGRPWLDLGGKPAPGTDPRHAPEATAA
jgi:O-antigen ligase